MLENLNMYASYITKKRQKPFFFFNLPPTLKKDLIKTLKIYTKKHMKKKFVSSKTHQNQIKIEFIMAKPAPFFEGCPNYRLLGG